jgi:hypothetical protein
MIGATNNAAYAMQVDGGSSVSSVFLDVLGATPSSSWAADLHFSGSDTLQSPDCARTVVLSRMHGSSEIPRSMGICCSPCQTHMRSADTMGGALQRFTVQESSPPALVRAGHVRRETPLRARCGLMPLWVFQSGEMP